MTKFKLNWGLIIVSGLATSIAWADSLELKNGSLIKGKFMGGTQNEISFQVGSTVQKYNVADIVSLKFDSEGTTSSATTDTPPPQNTLSTSSSALPDDPG